MILQALYEYYQKHPNEFPKFGFARKEIKYMIVLEEDGSFVRLENQFIDAKKKTGKMYPLPAEKKRSGTKSWMCPQFLWDHCGFLLGYDKEEDRSRYLQAFINSIESVPDELKKDPGIHAVLEFYRRKEYRKVFDDPEWKQCAALKSCNMTFRLKSEETPIAYRPAVAQYVSDQARTVGGKKGLCLITGKYGPIVKLMSRTQIPGSKASTSLVSFQEKQGYDSYGKIRCYNAPMSIEAEFACSTVFNQFLAKDSKNCFTMKKDKKSFTAMFWAEKKLSSASGFSLEDIIFSFAKASTDEVKDVTPIRTMCNALWKGKMPVEDSSVRYCFLWMTPNNARISVRLWENGTVGELARNLKQHFDDLGIVNGIQYPPLYILLGEVVPEKDFENVPPGLPDKIIHAAFNGSMYPATWRNLCLSRISASPKKKNKSGKRPERISPLQAAILKAFINRKQRLSKPVSQHNTTKEIKMDYDPDNPNPAYQCGALFAVIVKTQEEAAPDVNRTVCDSYFTAASTRPGSVFARLLSLNRVHLKKIRQSNHGRYVNLEKAIQEIAVKFGSKFPGMLTPDERASFCLGYYQRRQLFFKERSAETDNNQKTNQDNL